MRPAPRLPALVATARTAIPRRRPAVVGAAVPSRCATIAIAVAVGCGQGGAGETTHATGDAPAAAPNGVVPAGTYRARVRVRAVDYPDQTAVVAGRLRITDTTRFTDGVVAHFREDTAGRGAGQGYVNPYDGTVRFAGDTVWVSLSCTSCRVNAAFGPVSRTTEWDGRYLARQLGGGRFELRQVREPSDPPKWQLTVDTLVREGR